MLVTIWPRRSERPDANRGLRDPPWVARSPPWTLIGYRVECLARGSRGARRIPCGRAGQSRDRIAHGYSPCRAARRRAPDREPRHSKRLQPPVLPRSSDESQGRSTLSAQLNVVFGPSRNIVSTIRDRACRPGLLLRRRRSPTRFRLASATWVACSTMAGSASTPHQAISIAEPSQPMLSQWRGNVSTRARTASRARVRARRDRSRPSHCR
jgi:hypothetical protein